MTLQAGAKLGPYEITGPLGAGGMGEVYRARDTRLERTVAIKVLPEQFSQDSELKQRFEREAKTISSLNHPHICTLYDVGHQDGTDFLVMEYIEGESLSQRLAKGSVPTDQALKIGVQIADALDKAHRHGIVHRDLKPGNIMLTKSGAKLLDFGLAKPTKPITAARNGDAATRSRAAHPITRQGHITGTLEYMSPEQIEGKEADPRSDIFALGAVLYEMATGKRAFEGKSSISVASAILEKDPEPISKLQPMSPPALEHVVNTCLAKEPDERWQSAADVGRELRWISEGGSQAGMPAPVVSHRKKRERLIWIGAGVAVALLAGLAGWQGGLRTLGGRPLHLAVTLPEGKVLLNNSTEPVSISPDGTTVVYAAQGDDRKPQLYLRKLDSFESKPIPGTEDGMCPFFSSDGVWVGFMTSDDKLKKVSLHGGSSVIVDGAGPVGGAWAEDDTIYFVKSFTSGIYAVPAAGGQPRQITQPGSKPDDRAHLWPSVLPGGNGLIFTVWGGRSFNAARIEVLSFKTGKRKVLIEGGTGGRYLPNGYLAYAHDGTLFLVAFDPDRLEIKGAPVPVIEGVMMGASNGDAAFAVSANGTLVFQPGTFQSFQYELDWMDRSGKVTKITDEIRPYAFPNISPDGKKIALILESSTFDAWVYDLERDTLTKVSFGGDDYRPKWSPDGKMLAYDSSKSGHQQIYVTPASGQGREETITDGPEDKELYGWTADGREVVFARQNKDTGLDLYAAAVEGDHKLRPLVIAPFNQQQGRISPNGKWISYVSDESGQPEVFVQAMGDPGTRVQVSRETGAAPRWTQSGNELVYLSKGRLMSVKLAPGASLNPSKPVVLFEDKREWSGYDIAPDGRFVVARETGNKGTGTQINVVLHWFDEIKRAQK
ncbi:MAG: serine/threonine-protein kinase [Acidobacteriia bacterium]|nr:serine/threonine-protein kinase [Terriglobia bacterium]